ncbi:MAG: methyltransferase [Pseudomonadota bacterium]
MAGSSSFAKFRNRLLASPRFQRAAETFWPTRWVARRSARRLFDLIGGFVSSQVLAACLELDLLEALRDGPRPCAALAEATGIAPERFAVLAEAAAVIGLVEFDGREQIRLGELGAMLLGNPSLPDMIRHHAVFYGDLADPVALLRGQTEPALARFWPYAGGGGAGVGADAASAYTELMAATQPMVSTQVLRAVPLGGYRHIMDLGGGNGAFLRAVAERHQTPRLSLVDLPAVCSLARRSLADAGLGERIAIRPADFLADELPRDADLMTLIRIVHDHDDAAVQGLFSRIHAALPPGGQLLIAEPMRATPGAPLFGGVYFSFYLMAMGSGRPRRPDEIVEMLTKAGFRDCRLRRTAVPMVAQVMVATA